jgi:hypothetical protein
MSARMAARKSSTTKPAHRSEKPCSVEGCHRAAWAKGRCQSHYRRVYRGRSKNPNAPVRPQGSEPQLIATRVSAFAKDVLHSVASKRGIAPYALHSEILEKWAQEQVAGKID